VDVSSSSPVRLKAQFDCAPGELVALVGASGSGKTTLLRTVAGLHRSTDLAGSVRLGDQLWMDSSQGICLTAQQRRVGLVFQHYALFPHLNAINNIALCADSMPATGQNSPETQAKTWLERLGLADLAHRLPHELSGGQQQRVALARALVRIQNGSGVLLLDEPFSAVDAPMRQVLYRELAQLRQSLAVPIILVTHDLQEARRLADRLVIIDAGQSLQSGTPAHVIRSPRNARVAQLVGIHNHFHAQFHSAGAGEALLHWGELRLRVKDKGKIENGTAVTWVLAGEAVQLLSPSGAAQSDANLLNCSFTEMLPLGEISLCRIKVQGTPDTIQLNLPTAQLSAMGLATGAHVRLAVPLDAAHIMPLRV
jgi:molybdate transport system ATP-binding protein